MLGAFLALCSAATFALNNAFARRGVLTGSVFQALSISVPIGVPMFLLGAIVTGSLGFFLEFSAKAYFFFALAGILHFAWALLQLPRGESHRLEPRRAIAGIERADRAVPSCLHTRRKPDRP